LNPKSRGIVRLAGSDPTLPPKIYTNYFTDPTNYDQTTIIQGINRLNSFINTPAMQNFSASMLQFNITECNPLTYGSDAYWACYFKYFVQNLWHPAGSCKMGTAADPSAVVDPTLRVHGISGTVKVRVADASIMPQVVSGNTQCPCYAIGEKTADMVIAANP
jgi:choline dehydrogenase